MCEQREAETGKWLLEHPDFLEWEKGNKEMLWCCGSREISGTLELCQSKLTSYQLVLARQCLRKLSHYNKQGPTKLTNKVGCNRIS